MLDYTGNQEAAEIHFDLVEKSANCIGRSLDAWRYLKSANDTLPLITGNNIQAFQLGIAASDTDGLVMEFGVRFGTSIRQIAKLVDQEVHGFDSFEGLPEQWHDEPKGSYSTKGVIPNVPDNVLLYAGWFEDTLPTFLKKHSGTVRFMNIDCDIYSSTKTILDLLANRIVPGTVIVFDEYIGNEFWREDEFKAFQEAVVRNNWDYEYLCFSFFTKQVVVRIKHVH
ncbi:MAG: class I SAM-dependent methyltransferase [Nitrosomonadales bacterium]